MPDLSLGDALLNGPVVRFFASSPMKQPKCCPADGLVAPIAGHAFKGRVHVLEPAMVIGDFDDIARVLHSRGQERVEALRPLLFGDIQGHGHDRRHLSIGRPERHFGGQPGQDALPPLFAPPRKAVSGLRWRRPVHRGCRGSQGPTRRPPRLPRLPQRSGCGRSPFPLIMRGDPRRDRVDHCTELRAGC